MLAPSLGWGCRVFRGTAPVSCFRVSWGIFGGRRRGFVLGVDRCAATVARWPRSARRRPVRVVRSGSGRILEWRRSGPGGGAGLRPIWMMMIRGISPRMPFPFPNSIRFPGSRYGLPIRVRLGAIRPPPPAAGVASMNRWGGLLWAHECFNRGLFVVLPIGENQTAVYLVDGCIILIVDCSG